ncbi:MAG: hypothetical protein U0M06_03170, partial [Clostridia bacterium]|nr:hypothetical protein [Clostridia bacterium]
EEYDNTNGERPDSVIEELRLRQGNDSEHFDIGENRRNQGKDDTNDNYFVSGEGRSNRTGYSKNRTNAYRKPKAIGWHLNDDGSLEITYSDGTKEIEYPTPKKRASSRGGVFFDEKKAKRSLSYEGEQFAPIGNYSTPLNETALVQDIAPVAEGVAKNATTTGENVAPTRVEDAPVASDEMPSEDIIKTVKDRLNAKITNSTEQLEKTKLLRDWVKESYAHKIEKLQAQYDSKKNKDTKVAVRLKNRIGNLRRVAADLDTDLAKRISDIETRIAKTSEGLVFRSVTKVKGEGFKSKYDTTIYLKEGDVLVFEEEGRGYIRQIWSAKV